MAVTVAPASGLLSVPADRSVYRPELDVLRFFAFLAVFLFHFSRPVDTYVEHGVPRLVATVVNSLMQGGVFGVDLFFVLSAYLITDLLLREKEKFGELNVKSFYLRRILRIWPLYYFYIGLALLPALAKIGNLRRLLHSLANLAMSARIFRPLEYALVNQGRPLLTALNLLLSMATIVWVNRFSSRHNCTKRRHTLRMPSPLSWRKAAMVLKSGASRPVSHISSTLRCASRSRRRLDGMRFR